MSKRTDGQARVARTCIVVLGMHRSGTSALTRVLSLLGCDLPKTLMGADCSNETGHWESGAVMHLNDAVLASAGSCWDDWLAFNPAWYSSPKAEEFKAQASALLEEEFGSSTLFVLKDARICRIAPFWLDVMESAAVRPAIIIPVRNPLEVAASLERRNGFDPALGHLLWLRHVLEAEAATRGRARLFSSYDELLTSWPLLAERAQQVWNFGWPRLSAAADEEIDAYLTERHRHHNATIRSVTDNPILSVWLRDAFEIFNRWALLGESAEDFAALDTIRDEFDTASPAFARLVSSGLRAKQEAHGLRHALDDVQGKLAGTEAALAAGEGRRRDLEGDLHEMQSRLEAHVVERDQLTAERDGLQQRLSTLEQQLEQERTDFAERLAQQSEMQDQLSEWKAKAVELERVAGERDSLFHEAELARNQLQEAQNRLASVESALAQRQEEIAQAYAELAGQKQAYETLKEMLADSQARNEAAQRKLAESEAWVFRMAAERKAFESQAQRLERQLQAAEHERRQTEAAHERDKARWAARLNEAEAGRTELERAAAEKSELLERALDETRAVEARLDERFKEIASLTQMLQEKASAEASAREALARCEREMNAVQEQAIAEKQAIEARLAERVGEIAALTQELQTTQTANAATNETLIRTQAEVQAMEARLHERFGEIAALTSLLSEQEALESQLAANAEWLREASAILVGDSSTRRGRLNALLPSYFRRRRQLKILERKGLFDRKAYLSAHPDVANDGMDPLHHYIRHGITEGRRLG